MVVQKQLLVASLGVNSVLLIFLHYVSSLNILSRGHCVLFLSLHKPLSSLITSQAGNWEESNHQQQEIVVEETWEGKSNQYL